MKFKKNILIFFFILSTLSVTSQSTNICNAEEISQYSHGIINDYSIECDTLEYIEMLLNVYRNRYEACDYFRKKNNDLSLENSPKKTGAIISHSHRSNFVILYLIEYQILQGIKTENDFTPIINNNCNNDKIRGLYYEDIDAVNIVTNKKFKEEFIADNRALKKIYTLYLKWVKKAKKVGLSDMRKNNIKPLDGSKYEWSSDTTSTINKNNGEK